MRPFPARLEVDAWAAIFAFALVGLAARALEARAAVDRMLAALLAGLALGVGLSAAVELWPIGACAFAFLARSVLAQGAVDRAPARPVASPSEPPAR